MPLVETFLDGIDVTQYVEEGSVTHRLNRSSVCKVVMPSELCAATTTSSLRIVLNGETDFHGLLEGPSAIEDDGDEDTMWTSLEAMSPMYLLDFRRAMDSDGDYSNPSFIYTLQTGPQIVAHMINTTLVRVGPLPLAMGTVETGGASLAGAPTNWPASIAQVIGLLTETGELDVVEEFTSSPTTMAYLGAYNGRYGTDRSSSVRFEYATGAHNVVRARRQIDKSGLANRIRYLLGPRRATAADPAGDQHWDGSIDRTTVAQLPDPPQSTIEAARAQSEIDYYIREDTRIFDAQGDSSVLPRQLYLRHWQREAWLRLKPKTLINLTPEPGILPEFGVGDVIWVAAGSRLRGGFAGPQRVMEYTYRWDRNGVVELGAPVGQAAAAAVVTSADNEGLV